ncbi:RNA polymerase subunit sigma-24 [Solirubrobacter sp. CPCC 204708]|uniref:RNA polymerase subunit sigma-24 n=1 Tax=Solirubrobacter deserti TaxID=2282478 RepID=A0ABT4RJ24_9ACTN|nr:sigma factor-like helix-turn-helix DNA-binding protein [Solirubrobacter deserti]MDA0138544.1 RNA polymerase subunit sigma-24 [Solirubrobacter deserti]
MHRIDPATEAFVAHRNLLFTVAYEMLGRRPESYVGPWLPEPLLTAPDVAEDVELADSVSMAVLRVLETLGPTERAVFVLREVFDLPYGEIADAVGKTQAAVRQIARRARARVVAHRSRGVVSAAETREALAAFQHAVETGNPEALLDILAPGVALVTDGGGVVQAALAPVVGVERVAQVLTGIPATASLRPAHVNGSPALVLWYGDAIDTVLSVRIDDGLITEICAVRNPAKLSGMERETRLR